MPEPEYEYLDIHQEIEKATIPGTDDVIRSHSTVETRRLWLQACKDRGIVLDNPFRAFHHAACKALSPEWRSKRCGFLNENSPAILRQPKLIGGSDVFGFFKTAVDWFRSDDRVPQELANERAAICAMCPHNLQTTILGCTSCSGIASRLAEGLFGVIGGLKTTSDHRIHNCGICGCVCSVLVHTPISVLENHTDWTQPYPSHCWKLRESGRA